LRKKILIRTAVLIAAVLLATPFVATAHALGKPRVSETFYLHPSTDPATLSGYTQSTAPTEKKIGPDDSFRQARDAYRTYNYKGVLGEGILTQETILTVSKADGAYMDGGGTYQITLQITKDGGYGTGILEGILKSNWEINRVVGPDFRYDEWWTFSLHGKGDLNGLNVFAEAYATLVRPGYKYNVWWTTTTIMS